MFHKTSVKTALSATAVISALLIPAAGSASAASHASGQSVTARADSFDAKCRSHSRTYILKKYYRGPQFFTLRCGTRAWGWKHIKARHGWNSTRDRKIDAAIWSGDPNGRGGYSTYLNQCPRVEKFRTIIGTPAGTNDLLTAYKVDQSAVAGAARC
ncbi:hypothetical protein ACFOOM_20890 [Streptomyces echinoruber]|uniref:Secreted protein n=1 Tax=Streptomyces echinoruber TaxID=68898 RepID=A0A918QZ65_9ACTN|nr:hypothetical protein [Streptomyces echinoruber]GGZ76889.1 hypothetical protein GCM10010389_13240 [Streptomyces echinoruber]